MDIKKIIREEIEKLNEEIQSDLVLPKGKRIVLQADNPEVNRGLIVTWLEKGGYNVEYWYKDPSKIYPAEVVIDGKPITTDGKVVYLGYHPELDEGFGSDEFLTKTEKKKFEKERLENAEVLGYTLTGTKDIKESTKNYGKTLVNMLKDRKLKMLSSKDKKTLLKIAKMMKRANESVSAVNLDKEKNDERYPEQPNFNFDPEKGKSRIRKIRK